MLDRYYSALRKALDEDVGLTHVAVCESDWRAMREEVAGELVMDPAANKNMLFNLEVIIVPDSTQFPERETND